jgi:type II secretory pathway component PulM
MMTQFTRREWLLGIGMIASVAVWALYALAVKPANDRIHTLQRIIPEKQAELKELQTRSAEYVALQNEFVQLRTKMASQQSDFQLLPFLESVLERHKLTKYASMERGTEQPQPDYCEVVVTVELHDVSLRQIIDFLSDVETPEAVVWIGSLHIRKNQRNEALLDSTVGVFSPQLSQHAMAPQTAP